MINLYWRVFSHMAKACGRVSTATYMGRRLYMTSYAVLSVPEEEPMMEMNITNVVDPPQDLQFVEPTGALQTLCLLTKEQVEKLVPENSRVVSLPDGSLHIADFRQDGATVYITVREQLAPSGTAPKVFNFCRVPATVLKLPGTKRLAIKRTKAATSLVVFSADTCCMYATAYHIPSACNVIVNVDHIDYIATSWVEGEKHYKKLTRKGTEMSTISKLVDNLPTQVPMPADKKESTAPAPAPVHTPAPATAPAPAKDSGAKKGPAIDAKSPAEAHTRVRKKLVPGSSLDAAAVQKIMDYVGQPVDTEMSGEAIAEELRKLRDLVLATTRRLTNLGLATTEASDRLADIRKALK